MITAEAYWRGRDSKYRGEWTEVIQRNGIETVRRVNLLLAEAEKDGIVRDVVSSGWRPNAVNDATANAAKRSNHKAAKAGDIADGDDTDPTARQLQLWSVNHQNLLCKFELWMEHPGWCAKWDEDRKVWVYWCHYQTEPPASGKRVYIPSTKLIVKPLPGHEKAIPVRLKV